MVVAQGEVGWADIGEPIGSAPGYRRPVVVVQCDALNRSRIGTVVCVPLTSNLKWANAPGNVLETVRDVLEDEGRQRGIRRVALRNAVGRMGDTP